MDFYTYCKGRPKGVEEKDVYICEYRLDKTAHLFNPISRNKYPICTKTYAFDKFDKKLVPKRDYSPHLVPEHFKRGYGGRATCSKDKTDGEEGDSNAPQEGHSAHPVINNSTETKAARERTRPTVPMSRRNSKKSTRSERRSNPWQ
ncbi:histone-lysine N-methyltransferase ASH1L-like [Patiria miniata]|uniref:Uncharacterized protein n=1 Tax=Patiria miniata TaxID=46514 RepID=A0A914BBU1_PATMI|nr:histone-lysine N-methyltransferase ASH1L-like [Patiria miniata]